MPSVVGRGDPSFYSELTLTPALPVTLCTDLAKAHSKFFAI